MVDIPTRKLKFAHVGAFKTRSSEDAARTIESVYRIMNRDREFICGTKAEHDTINLVHGRDFLKEDRKYDVVILHSIFNPSSLKFATGKAKKWLKLSPKHSIANWVKRLAKTRAVYISVCEGQPHTLSGWQLGNIPGYEILERDTKVTLYRKSRK